MKTPRLLALLAVALLASSTAAFAGDHSCCASAAQSDPKEACLATFANLDLTAEQKSKMETLADECVKTGCTKESMSKMEAGAKGILSKKQFASWKAKCSGMTEKTQS